MSPDEQMEALIQQQKAGRGDNPDIDPEDVAEVVSEDGQ